MENASQSLKLVSGIKLFILFFSEKNNINLWSYLKQCIGKELSKITMPVQWNEPISLLQVSDSHPGIFMRCLNTLYLGSLTGDAFFLHDFVTFCHLFATAKLCKAPAGRAISLLFYWWMTKLPLVWRQPFQVHLGRRRQKIPIGFLVYLVSLWSFNAQMSSLNFMISVNYLDWCIISFKLIYFINYFYDKQASRVPLNIVRILLLISIWLLSQVPSNSNVNIRMRSFDRAFKVCQ